MGTLTPAQLLEKMRSANLPLSDLTIDRLGGEDLIEEGYGGIPESNDCDQQSDQGEGSKVRRSQLHEFVGDWSRLLQVSERERGRVV